MNCHILSSDKEEVREDMHTSDTVQEKLSLYARFGVSIYFGAPSKKEFQHIVVSLAEKNGITMDEETLLAEANKWELAHGSLLPTVSFLTVSGSLLTDPPPRPHRSSDRHSA